MIVGKKQRNNGYASANHSILIRHSVNTDVLAYEQCLEVTDHWHKNKYLFAKMN